MRNKVIIPVGLPGSGKSTWIKGWRQQQNHQGISAVVSGDDLRLMMNMGEYRWVAGDTDKLNDIICAMVVRLLDRYPIVYIDEYYICNTVDKRQGLFNLLRTYADVEFQNIRHNLGTCIHRRCLNSKEIDTSRWPNVLIDMARTFEPYTEGEGNN